MYEEMNEENIIKTNHLYEFEPLVAFTGAYEVGISFEGETKVSDDVRVFTKKEIKCKDAAEAKDTYLKVMEMRALTKEEEEFAHNARGFFKKVYKEICKNSKFWVVFTTYLCWYTGHSIRRESIFGTLIGTFGLAVYLKPVKFYKLIKSFLKRPERLDELSILLHEKNISGYAKAVDDDKDIQLYLKYEK